MLDISPKAAAASAAADLFAGAGELGERIGALDWSRTPLGPMREWPSTLHAAVRVLLATPQPACIWWGGELTTLYNDACVALLGEAHPAALGAPGASAWKAAWPGLALRAEAAVLANEAFVTEPMPFTFVRQDEAIEAHFVLSCTPLPGERPGRGGALCVFTDVTRSLQARAVPAALYTTDSAGRIQISAELAATRGALASQVETLTRLHELAMRLGGMSDLHPAMKAILDTAVEVQDASQGLIWLEDPESGDLLVHASRGFDGEKAFLFERVTPGPGGGGAGNAFDRRCRWVIEDTEADPAFLAYRDAARAAGFRAVHSTPIVTRSGALLGVLSVHYARPRRPSQRDVQAADVCARHAADAIEAMRSQEALRESERLYRAIGESIDYGVWLADAEGNNTYTSESFLRLTGTTQERCAGMGWTDVVHPDDAPVLLQRWGECLRGKVQLDQEFRVHCAGGGYRTLLGRGVPVCNARGSIVAWVGINLDIERLKQVENELRELDQRKNEFLATLAHELRNPLAPLRNGLEVMRLASGDAATVEKARAMMERQLAQMVRLVDDLLDVSRVSRGKIELRRADVELAVVLHNALETSQPLMAERRHELAADIPARPILVHGDATRLAQVFWNLLNNAAKYTEPGGRVELSARLEGGEVAVRIRDNGIGIPPDMQGRVFDIFTQVDRSLEKAQGGLGIGLSIAKRLVEMHGGAIAVRSDGHGRGTEFTVRLPALPAAVVQA